MVRAKFNDRRFYDAIASGRVSARVIRNRPAPSGRGEPTGTMTQIIRFEDSRGRVQAVAHRYLRPDGTIGGFGSNDPKWLLDRQVEFLPSHDNDTTCQDCATWQPRALATKGQS
jgi:hypothetical protein